MGKTKKQENGSAAASLCFYACACSRGEQKRHLSHQWRGGGTHHCWPLAHARIKACRQPLRSQRALCAHGPLGEGCRRENLSGGGTWRLRGERPRQVQRLGGRGPQQDQAVRVSEAAVEGGGREQLGDAHLRS